MKTRVLSGVAAICLVAVAGAAGFAVGGLNGAGGSGGTADGVVVHGDWTITVKDRDGSVVDVYRFQNEFNGATTVASILAHQSATGRFWQTLSDQTGAGNHPCGATTLAASCFVFEPDDPNGAVPGWFDTLDVSASGGQLVITSEVEATRDGSFNHVRMLLSTCSSTTAPSACHPGSYGNFSQRTLASPVTLVAGQQVLTTVTYTFSPA